VSRSNLKKRRGRKMSLVVEGEEEGGIIKKVQSPTLLAYLYAWCCRYAS